MELTSRLCRKPVSCSFHFRGVGRVQGNRGKFRFLTKKSKKICFSATIFRFCVSSIIENIFSNITNNSCPDGERRGEENEHTQVARTGNRWAKRTNTHRLPGRGTEGQGEHTPVPDGKPRGEENEQQLPDGELRGERTTIARTGKRGAKRTNNRGPDREPTTK